MRPDSAANPSLARIADGQAAADIRRPRAVELPDLALGFNRDPLASRELLVAVVRPDGVA